MAKQNIYDNDSFFENFKNLRNNKINFNDCIETPILLAMIPEVDGKRVLDIGCLLYTSPSPRDLSTSRMPSSA